MIYKYSFWLTIDYTLLHFFNVTLGSPKIDPFWIFITHLQRQTWLMFGVLPLLIAYLVYIYGGRVLRALLAVGIAVGLADLLAYRVVKALVNRPRPLQNPEIQDWLRKVGEAHGPSFPSNHAANCFAGAAVLSWYFPNQAKYFYTFAALVGLSRVALGVHYPSDVVSGAILGFFVGFVVRIFILERANWFRLRPLVSKEDQKSPGWRVRSRRLQQD